MKVTLTYKIEYTKDVEMTPEEYLEFRASKAINDTYFPKESIENERMFFIDAEAEKELDNYFYNKN